MNSCNFSIHMAGLTIRIHAQYGEVKKMCERYLTDKKEEFSIDVSEEEILNFRERMDRASARRGESPLACSPAFCETLVIYEKIAEEFLDRNRLLVHGSAIAVDGQAYLFVAKSGTGKSTHTRLWREMFPGRTVMINDDKPILWVQEDQVLVCGTPWDGKHRLSTNVMMPLKGFCILTRSENNFIEKISVQEAYPMLLQQTYRPHGTERMERMLSSIDRMAELVPLYRLGCNMDMQAASVSFEGMQ